MQSDIEKLKEILFGHEKKALDAITRRLDTAESRAADVADVLPDAIDRSAEQGPRLRQSLQKPLEDTLTEAIVRDPSKFAAALYPVIGPAIRRAVSESMKALIDSMNRAIDTSLSPMARFKARQAGVPLAEWVLRESLIFRVDDIFLIDPRSGLLIEHVHHEAAGDKDEDAVSAMLTAIQDFVRDSFSSDSDDLNSATVGDYTVWISHGPYAMLAAVIRGTPPADLRDQLDGTVERLHLSHGQALKNFQGGRIGNVAGEIVPCLRLKLRPDATRKRGLLRWPLVLLLLLALGALAALGWRGYQRHLALDEWRDALNSEPGLVVTEVWRDGGEYFASGLRDPLAALPTDIATGLAVEGAPLTLDFRPFVSLEDEMVAARAEATLVPPDGVTLTFDQGVLSASGDASPTWRERFVNLAPALTGVKAIDVTGLTSSDTELFARIMRELAPADTVQLKVTDGVAIFVGEASTSWMATLSERLTSIEGLRGSDLRGLRSVEQRELERLTLAINDHLILYNSGTALVETQSQNVASLARKMIDYGRNAAALSLEPSFRLVGLTDGLGEVQSNQRLRLARAQDMKLRLINLGVNGDWLVLRSGNPTAASETGNPNRRAVRVDVAEPIN